MTKQSLLFLVTLACATAALADPTVSRTFSSSAASGSIKRIVIDLPAGDVTIRNGRSDAIAISGTVRRTYDGPAERTESQRIVDDAAVAVYASADEAVIRRQFGPNAQGWRAQNHNTEFEVTIEVPEGTAIEVGTRYGNVKLEGTFGNVNANLRAGNVDMVTPRATVRDLRASCRVGNVDANLGDVIIEREGVFPRSTHFEGAGTANIHLHVTAGNVEVKLTQ